MAETLLSGGQLLYLPATEKFRQPSGLGSRRKIMCQTLGAVSGGRAAAAAAAGHSSAGPSAAAVWSRCVLLTLRSAMSQQRGYMIRPFFKNYLLDTERRETQHTATTQHNAEVGSTFA